MNTLLPLETIKEHKKYIITAILGTIAVSGIVLAMQERNTVNNINGFLNSFDIKIMESFAGTNSKSISALFDGNEQPKFSIDEYVDYTSIENFAKTR